MEIEINSPKLMGGINALEIINLSYLQEIPEGSYLKKDFKSWVHDETKADKTSETSIDEDEKYTNNSNSDKKQTQFISFQRAMKVLLTYGQCVGLNPVTAALDHDISKIRFKWYSWRFLYTALIVVSQTLIAIVSMNTLVTTPVSIISLALFFFALSNWCTVIIFIRIATKWENLVKELFNSKLNKYVDPGIYIQCNVLCIVFLITALADLIFYTIMKISEVLACITPGYNFYEKIIRNIYPSYFEQGIPYNIPIAIFLQLNMIYTSAIWNYSDIFVISISLYLTSILNEINKKILWAAEKNYLPSSSWGALREDYSRATRLIRLFDEVLSGLILLSFITNLFWICLGIFNLLENGIRPKHINYETCPYYGNGPFYGYEHPIYRTFSLIFLTAKFATMCLVAAGVNVAASVPASALYKVPCCSYSIEVQRFLEQVHYDFVALTGLEYFHVTRELILSVAGTMLTYELVLLQIRSEELNYSY